MKVKEALARLNEFRGYKKGWDSYGGEPIDQVAIIAAENMAYKLGDGWQPVPCSDGSVQLEFHGLHRGNPIDMELSIYVSGKDRK